MRRGSMGASELSRGSMRWTWRRASTRSLNRWPAVGLAVGVVRDGRLEFFHGHGLADIASSTPITEDTVFRIASITKTFTAIAVMQLWEQGLVDLDAPANDYLRAYRLIPAKARLPARDGATSADPHGRSPGGAAHLRRVQAGLRGELRARTTAADARRVLPRRSPPGGRAGHQVHLQRPRVRHARPDRRGRERAAVGPATCASTSSSPSAWPTPTSSDPSGSGPAWRRATRCGPTAPRAVIDREWVTAGASSIYSTPRDMARYVAALLGGGANEHGSRARAGDACQHVRAAVPARSPRAGHRAGVLPGHPRRASRGRARGDPSRLQLPDLRGSRRRGRGDGLHERGQAGDVLVAGVRSPGCSAELLERPDDVIRTDVPHHPEIWGDICGWYRLSARLTDARARLMIGAGAEVFVRRGQLMLRVLSPIPALYRGFPLHPDDDTDPTSSGSTCRSSGSAWQGWCSVETPDGATTRLHLDLMPLYATEATGLDEPEEVGRPAVLPRSGWAPRRSSFTDLATTMRRRGEAGANRRTAQRSRVGRDPGVTP